MDFFKTYDSGHLYSVGRIIVVVTVHKDGQKFIVETFAFSSYNDEIFKGLVATYNFDATEMIDSEIETHAKNMMDQVLFDKYESDKDIDTLTQNPIPTETSKSNLISMKVRNYHVDKFADIRDKTNCESLRKYLDTILSIPEITITDYP
jgi:hypothetical protein